MAENKKSFVLYCDLIHTVESLTDEEAGNLFKHLLRYVNDLSPNSETRLTAIVFEPIKQQLKRDLEKWDKKIDKLTDSGRLGGLKSAEARALKRKQIEANASNFKQIQPVNDNVSVSVNVNDNVIKGNIFKIPLVDEIVRYCLERNNKVDANYFFDFYQSKNWMIGKNKMKDWKACVRTWEKNSDKYSDKNKKFSYEVALSQADELQRYVEEQRAKNNNNG